MFRNQFLRGIRSFSTSHTLRSQGKKSIRQILKDNRQIILGSSLFGLGITLGFTFGITRPNPDWKFPESSTTPIDNIIPPQYAFRADMFDGFNKISKLIGESNVSYDNDDLNSFATNSYSTHLPKDNQKPKMICYPRSTEEVSQIMKIANEYSIPVVPYSGGTSIEGNFISTQPGLLLSLSNMDSILQFNKDDLDVTVQPAVGWQDLNAYLEPEGFMIGPDPGPGGQIGGMIGTSCSGTNAARFGTMKENVLSLIVVLADGTIIKTKNRPRKSSAGYNLTGLFIGSEGTLGIVTEATLKVHVKPKFERVSVVSFPKIVDATNMVTKLIQEDIVVNAVELLDDNMIDVINKSGQLNKKWKVTPTLLVKIGGSEESVLSKLTKKIEDISIENNSIGFESAGSNKESEDLWTARKIGFWSTIEYAKQHIDPNIKVWVTDVAVPISKLSKVIEETSEEVSKSKVFCTILGHVGDGNFHCILTYKPDEYEKVKTISENTVRRAILNEGTCTGEHGIGVGKRKYLIEELGINSTDLMRKLKFAMDPKRILNPDKIIKIDPEDPNKF
ncbi:hypothetical protein BN7_1512 [Wickerhamomyces ciferrii]|uniref:D-lactate dehydrogenase (cytochrome) n=1 Tax=Wickerhamomyces ciferrii (strain ATCC 14091 / BCRC 22168 / CBS 111 / JCM 3599 / NBRC 0793 / NRRL Y-1031 F-60-10) TaxID=1206466 RepID=K0KLH6_WICCF|nr:uncharacterized protein BN7_1512 [Wickerhamomyces ciferrii]CCH41973.1 hypothetical protein BN7_1512 [Wickerhamomyces ciferrii]